MLASSSFKAVLDRYPGSRIQKVDEPPAYKTKTKTKTKPRPRPGQDEDSPPPGSSKPTRTRDIDIGLMNKICAVRYRTPRQEGRTDGIPPRSHPHPHPQEA
ncbi:hypothetical protein B0H13DRAFT_2338803 [Mycena leptocephala]|nr:hypothetical protein B0H13DRAFT_2338803 [Mycena leptocephala]